MAEYKLTEEGEQYLKEGLPEKNLAVALDSLPTKSATIGKLFSKVKNLPIAMKWALEKGWIAKKGDELTLMKPPHVTVEEEALKKIHDGKQVDESVVKIILERKLAWKVTETYKKTEDAIAKGGNVIGVLTHDMIRTGLWKGKKFRAVNVEVVKKIGGDLPRGNRQPYVEFLMDVRRKLAEMGFKEMRGPTVELEFWNFDALYQPQMHPARDWTSSYSLKQPKYGTLPSASVVTKVKAAHENGWKTGSTGWQYKWSERKASQLMPRAHDTAISPRYLAKGVEIPGRYFSMVRCYRPDVIDATHGVEFYQLGGFVIAKDLNFKHLLWLLRQFATEIAGIKEIEFTAGYFPFVEPGIELSGKHPELGWIELAGAGIFRPEMTEPLGIKDPVIAWGFGVDRLAMHALKIKDIRELFSRNLEWLRCVNA